MNVSLVTGWAVSYTHLDVYKRQTWMDANKAIELGFADEIIQRNGAVDMEVPQVSMLYSKTAVVNSLMDKIAEKCRIQQKNETENSNKVKADSLMSRLNLMKNWR